MWEAFNESKSTSFEFQPGGYIETGICGHGSENAALHWDDTTGLKYATTQQLIVQENFMIQFKVNNTKSHALVHCRNCLSFRKLSSNMCGI